MNCDYGCYGGGGGGTQYFDRVGMHLVAMMVERTNLLNHMIHTLIATIFFFHFFFFVGFTMDAIKRLKSSQQRTDFSNRLTPVD